MQKKFSINRTFLLLLLLPFTGFAQVVSPFNKRVVVDSDSFSFVITGHLHGASYNNSGYPASSLVANIDTINALKPVFMASLGDMFIDFNEEDLKRYDYSFFSKASYPIFNAVGNHDLGRGLYKKKFGSTFHSFISGKWGFIFLDTEIHDGSIKDEQLSELTKFTNRPVEGIFVFTHRPVWAENNERYERVFPDNTKTEIGTNNFETEIKPILGNFVKSGKKVFWCSGSLGSAPSSFFYDEDPENGIIYIASAIRNLKRDAILLASVEGANVRFRTVSLTFQDVQPLETYNLDFWLNNRPEEEKFNFRLIPYLIKQMVLHYYFWFGAGSTLLLFFIVYFFRRRR